MKFSKFTLLSIFIIIISCKTDKNNKQVNKKTSIKNDYHSVKENDNCLLKTDTLELKQFKIDIASAIRSRDKNKISTYINFPYRAANDSLGIESFLKGDVDIVINYFNENLINKEERQSLKSVERFIPISDSDCYNYYIERNFSDFEFVVFFYLKKVNNKIKIVRIESAG